jgi:hypothetical protein
MRLCLFFLIFTLCGCSADTVKRLTYEAGQNLRQQQCQKNLSATDCNTRQSYDSYQQNLQEVK